jgi:HK97 family phage major capsid protein
MKIKFVKNYLGNKINDEIEAGDEAAELIAKGFAVEVKVDAADEAVKSFQNQMAEVSDQMASEIAEKAATKALEKIAKGCKKPAIYVGADNAANDPAQGFKSFAEYAQTVKAASKGDAAAETRLKATGNAVGVDADGGYAVPPVWASEIFTALESQESIFSLTDNLPLSGAGSTFVQPLDDAMTIGANGVQWVNRTADGSTLTVKKPTLAQRTISVHKAAYLMATTEELEADGLAIQSYLSKKAATAFNYALNQVVIRGNGTDQPLGIIGSEATITQTRNTANTVKLADLRKMWARRYGNSFVWIVNQEVEEQLFDLSDAAGRNLYFAPGAIKDSPYGTLFGSKVIVSQHASSLGVEGDVILADLSYYRSVTKGGLNYAVSPHLYFNKDENAYRWTFRVGGRPKLHSVITPATGQGTKTLSPFVVLDDATT